MNKTFGMIKPDAVNNKFSGDIIKLIELNKFSIIRMQKIVLSVDQAKQFYIIHKDRSFFDELISYISSGPVLVFVLQKDNAVEEWRKLMGATNPIDAEVGTIRKMYGVSIGENAVHGSDSNENAKIEMEFFFKNLF
jgi:nucleoside-diphosphate kinase